LYQYGVGDLTNEDLLCNYPIISKKASTGASGPTAGPASSITYPTPSGRNVTVAFGAAPKKQQSQYIVYCRGGNTLIDADPAFLNPPSCVICDDPSYAKLGISNKCDTAPKKPGQICLHVNYRLRNNWLKWSSDPFFTLPTGAIYLGDYQGKHLYVQSADDLESFYEFALFVLEATTQTATSSTGKVLLGAPTVLLQ
jgi:hypothetical protein